MLGRLQVWECNYYCRRRCLNRRESRILCRYCRVYVVVCAEGSNLRSEVGGVGASLGDSSPELRSFRPYMLVLPPGGEVDLIDFRIAGVNSSVSAAINLHSGDEWVFCVPRHQQYRSGRVINFFLGRSDSSSVVVSASDFRSDRFDFLFRFERFFSVFSLRLVERGRR